MFGIPFLSKPLLLVGGVTIILGMLGTAYAHVNGLKNDIETLALNNASLTVAVDTQTNTINSIQSDLEIQREINQQFADSLQNSVNTVNRLRRDLRSITSKVSSINVDTASPDTIAEAETEVNTRYNDLMNCFGKGANDECNQIPVTP
jgi:hypothetical protein